MDTPIPPPHPPSPSLFSDSQTVTGGPSRKTTGLFAPSITTTFVGTSYTGETPRARTQKPFQDRTHFIPTPITDKKILKRYDPLVMRLPVIIGTPLAMFLLGIALEIGVAISQKQNGFPVPEQNVVSFVSTQFLIAFFPTLFVIPVAFLWRELDWNVRWYQPYVVLSNQGGRADEVLLTDYISLGPFLSLFRSLHHKHKVVFWSSITASASYILQPLASSIFQIRQIPQIMSDRATSIKTIGLIPDVDELNAFVAAAGFAEAAAFHGLGDPPFVFGGWTTAEFVFPTSPLLNGTMTVNTTGIQVQENCDNGVGTYAAPVGDFFSITSTSADGCEVTTAPFNPNLAATQYGIRGANCGTVGNDQIEFQPVMFWFFAQRTDGKSPNANAIFCRPSIKPFSVTASANLGNGSLSSVKLMNEYTEPNNVTSEPLFGKAYNSVLFANSTNPFIQARATATTSAISGAIFRFARSSSLQTTFDNPNGFLDITRKIYKQHLAVSAKSIYFVPDNTEMDAELLALTPKLWIDPLPAHLLAIILLSIGAAGVFIHILNWRQRRGLILTSPPGTIAAIVAMTARSGFGDLLLPYDNEAIMEKKLQGLWFRLDKHSGAIVADDAFTDLASYESHLRVASGNGRTSVQMGGVGAAKSEESYAGLLANQAPPPLMVPVAQELPPSSIGNSSLTAQQAAMGYPPWKAKPLVTPYDP